MTMNRQSRAVSLASTYLPIALSNWAFVFQGRYSPNSRIILAARFGIVLNCSVDWNRPPLIFLIGTMSKIVRLGGRIDFDTLNGWIYAEVFRTPRQNAWLGLLPRDVFTGLPGDGVVIR